MEVEERLVVTSNNSERLKCRFCGKLSKSLALLNDHLQRVHKGISLRNDDNSDGNLYLCSDCGKQYTTMAALLVHRNKAHLLIKPYQCTICAASFSGSAGLCQHRKIHQTELTHKCTECGKLFKLKQSLLTHSRIHSNSQEFSCSVCRKHFTQKSAMIRHQRIHSGDRPFRCSLCFSRFADVSVLRRHCIGIHNVQKFKYDSKLHFCETVENDTLADAVESLTNEVSSNLNANESKQCFVIPEKATVSVLNPTNFAQLSCSQQTSNLHFTFPTSVTCFEHLVSDMFDIPVSGALIEHNETPDVMAEEVVNSACITYALPVSIKDESSLNSDVGQDGSRLSDDLAVCYAEVLPISLDMSESLASSDDAVCF